MALTIISLIIFCISIFLRIFPRLYWKEFSGTDSYFHFYYINLIKKNKNKLPKTELRVLGGSNQCTYPFFYHWVLSFFSKKALSFWDKNSGFIFDLLTAFIVIFLIQFEKIFTINDAYLFLASYIISPGLTFSFIGPRPYTLTPRNFSQFIFAFGCMCLMLGSYYLFPVDIIFLIFASVSFAILFLSSQFGTQVLFFISLLIFFNLKIGGVIILSFILSLLFFRGFIISQIMAQLRHLEWYFKYNYKFVQHKTNFRSLINILRKLQIRNLFYELVFYNQLSTTFLRHFTFWIALALGFHEFYTNNMNNFNVLQKDALFIMFSLMVAFIVTSFGRARVLGDAERYIEFAYPLQMFLFFSIIPKLYIQKALFSLIFYNFVWYSYNIYQIKNQNILKYSYQNLINLLIKKNTILLCLSNNESYIFLSLIKAKIVGFLVNISMEGKYHKFFKRFFLQYPLVNPRFLDKICSDYNVTHILKNKKINHDIGSEYDKKIKSLKIYKLIYEDEKYTLYEKNI